MGCCESGVKIEDEMRPLRRYSYLELKYMGIFQQVKALTTIQKQLDNVFRHHLEFIHNIRKNKILLGRMYQNTASSIQFNAKNIVIEQSFCEYHVPDRSQQILSDLDDIDCTIHSDSSYPALESPLPLITLDEPAASRGQPFSPVIFDMYGR